MPLYLGVDDGRVRHSVRALPSRKLVLAAVLFEREKRGEDQALRAQPYLRIVRLCAISFDAGGEI